MNNIIHFKGQKVAPAFAHLDPNRSLGDGVTAGGFPILNYKGKNWNLRYQGQSYPFLRPDDGTALSYVDVIIVGDNDAISKIYFGTGVWDEDTASGPICAAIRGVAPDPGVPQPQSKTCATCSHNEWKTLPNGKRGMECQSHKRLAILLMPAVTTKMLGSPLKEPVYLKVPPGSLASLKTYGDQLRHEGYPFEAVVTRISFHPKELFQMVFEGKQLLTDREAPLVLPLLDDPRTKRITGEAPMIREVTKEPARIATGLEEGFSGQAQEPQEPMIEAPMFEVPMFEAPMFEAPLQEIIPPPQKKRGRPAKVVVPEEEQNDEEAVEEIVAKPVKARKTAPPPVPEAEVDEEDNELDDEINSLLNQRVESMLK